MDFGSMVGNLVGSSSGKDSGNFSLMGAAGDFVSSATEAYWNRKESDENRRFQRAMSNTGYRRAANDLEKAGLNRILAIGSPSSTPSGSFSSISRPKLVEQGLQVASAKQSIAQSKAQEDLLKAQRDLSIEQKNLIHQQGRSAEAQADKDVITRGLYSATEPMFSGLIEKAREGLSSSAKAFRAQWPKFLDGAAWGSGFEDAPAEYQSSYDPESRTTTIRSK